jgi:glycosyltransferase involved in cell wall biosynthesis
MAKPAAHVVLARAVARQIRLTRPDAVIVQNWCIPPVETPVYTASREVGAALIVVVHDHRLHSRVRGTTVGLWRRLRSADMLVCHSHYVADRIAARTRRRDVTVIAHPVQIAMLGTADRWHGHRQGAPVAVHYGVLWRRNKGTRVVAEIAERGVPPWSFEIFGAGAPANAPGALTDARFIPAAELVQRVANATACLLPYRWASQSGAVVLAQAVGTIPVVSAVGGIPEQVTDGITGRLVPPGAGPDVWRGVLDELSDTRRAQLISSQAQRHAWGQHHEFTRSVLTLSPIFH